MHSPTATLPFNSALVPSNGKVSGETYLYFPPAPKLMPICVILSFTVILDNKSYIKLGKACGTNFGEVEAVGGRGWYCSRQRW